MGLDRKLEGMLPAKPAKGGVTSVPDETLRAAVKALRKTNAPPKWRW